MAGRLGETWTEYRWRSFGRLVGKFLNVRRAEGGVRTFTYAVAVEEHPRATYQAWHLARSLRKHCKAEPVDIHFHFGPGVPAHIRSVFSHERYQLHALAEDAHTSMLSHLSQLVSESRGRVALLDARALATADLRPLVDSASMRAGIADLRVPPTDAAAKIRYFDSAGKIALLCYPNSAMNVMGLIEPTDGNGRIEAEALAAANQQISEGFHNRLFWDYRYGAYPERGSGVGSRGANAKLKRQILCDNGIERTPSILDVGCGDMEVLREFSLQNYLGIDTSIQAIQTAKLTRPDLKYELFTGQPIEPKDMVLCFEVLIHQTSRPDYLALIDFICKSARRTLLVSGYDHASPHYMCYFYEPLIKSLTRAGVFTAIQKVGEHTDVVIYRCDR